MSAITLTISYIWISLSFLWCLNFYDKPLKNLGPYILIYIFKSQALVLFLLWSFPHIIIYTQYTGLYFCPMFVFFAPLHLQNGFSPPKIHSDAVDVLKEIWFETLEFAVLNLPADNEGEKDKNKMGIYF